MTLQNLTVHLRTLPSFFAQVTEARTSGIHSEVKILQHLRSRLKGAALQAVSGALLSGALLDDVMSIITKRFGNPRLVVKNVCDKLLSRARVKVSDVNDLTSFSIDIDNTASVIKATGIPIRAR